MLTGICLGVVKGRRGTAVGWGQMGMEKKSKQQRAKGKANIGEKGKNGEGVEGGG